MGVSGGEQLPHLVESLGCRVQGLRFRGGLVFKAHRLCVSLNSRLESNKEEKKKVETLHESKSAST